MDCFGKRQKGGEKCRGCEFGESCSLYARTEKSMNRPLGHVSLDKMEHLVGDGQDRVAPKPGSREELLDFLRFLSKLDEYTLGIVLEVVDNPDRSVAALARLRGVSRQALHRKMLDACRKTPETAGLFGLVVKKIAKSRQEFRPKPKTRIRLFSDWSGFGSDKKASPLALP